MKKILTFLNKYKFVIVPGILGAIAFIYIYGTKVLNPTNNSWILNNGGDLTQHYIGFEFYRSSPWTFPIGMITSAPYPYSVSLIFTDCIPFFAIIFKVFSNLLPTPFQYLGLYGMLCFILQGITSSIVLKKFIKNDYLVILLSIFFIFSPLVIYRMFYHTALSSQYLIFLAFILVLYKDRISLKKTIIYWGLLGMLCVSIHMYFLLFDGIILIGYMLYELLSSKKVGKVIASFVSYISTSMLTTFILGGFSLPINTLGRSQIGTFSFNLNGLFNPWNGWSKFINELKTPDVLCQEEGFAYLGLGLIIVLILSIILFIYKVIRRKKLNFDKKLLISIIVVSLISIIVAVAYKVYIGNTLLFEITIPKCYADLIGIFRSNGRVIWIFYNILILLCFYILNKIINKKVLFGLIILLLGVQLYDISDKLKDKNNLYNKFFMGEYDSIYSDYKFNRLFQEDFDNVILTFDNNIAPFNLLAIKYNKKINEISLTQGILDDLKREDLIKYSKKIEKNSIYIIDPLDYLVFKDLDLNYYTLDGYILATKLELDYLEKYEKVDKIEKKIKFYKCFMLNREKKYHVKLEGIDEKFDSKKIEMYGYEFEKIDNGIQTKIENNDRVCINIDNIEVNMTLTELTD